MNTFTMLLVGAGFGIGVLLVVASVRGVDLLPEPGRRRQGKQIDRAVVRRGGVGAVLGLIVVVLTGWLVLLPALIALFVAMPWLFGSTAAGQRELERAEALANWTESLRDTVAGGMALENAIPATLTAAPPLMIEPLENLIGRMETGQHLIESLARFGDDIDSAYAERVVAAMMTSASLRGPDLVAALTRLATDARARMEVIQSGEARRKPTRRSAWVITGGSLAVMALLGIANRGFLDPYGTAAGQIVLLFVLGMFAAAFAIARRLSDYKEPERMLITGDELIATMRRREGIS